MTRKHLRTWVLLAIGIASAAAGSWWFTRTPSFTLTPDADQNVLLITIDTLRADALSVYGGKTPTPNLDRLASRGARFTFAHAHAVVTLPSHTSILTGRYPFEHGMRDNSGYRVAPGTVTMATRLKVLGFATGAFVGGFPLTKRFGLTPGFDVYDDRISSLAGPVDFSLPERRADAVVTSALDWIGRQQGKFFAWVHVFDPHAPYDAPAPFKAQYASNPYDGEVAWTDHALGVLLDRLSVLPRKTLVIVTADHGESLGEHGEATHGLFAYESTLHVPLIVAVVDPKATVATPGMVVTSAVRHIDILPTVLDEITAAADATLPGRSLRDLMAGGGRVRKDDRPQYFEAMTNMLTRGWAPLRGVMTGGDKYIDLPIPELYHLNDDPGEQRNEAARDQPRAAILLNILRSYHAALPQRPGRESPEVSEQLRALGYVSGSGTIDPSRTFTEEDDPKRLIGIDQALHDAGDLYQHGRIQESIEAFEKVIIERPLTSDAYRYQAFVYWRSGQPEAAIQTLLRAQKNGATDREVLIRLGLYLAERGDTSRAIAILVPLAGDDVEALNALGVAYGSAGRAAEGRAVFERVLRLDPTNGLAFQNIGTIELRGGQLNAAETSLRNALRQDPTLAGAYTTLGVILSRTNRHAEAIESWMRAVEIDGTEFNALYNLTLELSDAGRIVEARAYGGRFLATAPKALFAQELDEIRRLLR